jgi:hypothetical protein
MSNRMYRTLPKLPDAGLLTRYLDTLSILVPLARTNLIICPSFENGFTGTQGPSSLAGTTYALTTAYTTTVFGGVVPTSYHGARAVEISAGTLVGIYWSLITPAGITAFSCKFLGAPNVNYQLDVVQGGATVAIRRFLGTGRWQWVWVLYTSSGGSAQHRIVRSDASSDARSCFVDGIQVESCATDGLNVPTTYIDGDQRGLVPNQFPPAYGWNGVPQASTSYRTGQTRAGGYLVRFRDLGFLLTAIIGLGLAPPDHQALTFAQLDGGQYQNTLKPPRQFSLAGRMTAASPTELDTAVGQLGALLDRDLVAQRQPLVLTTQALECGAPCGDAVQIPALYSGGLEGGIAELPTAALPITFTQYLPFVRGQGQGVQLPFQASLGGANRVMRRSPTGVWGTLGTGAAGGNVYAIARGLDGLIYLAGDFTSFNGIANTARICSYDPVTGTVAALGTGAASGLVIDLQIAPNGTLYAVGTFANMGGVAAADFVAIWDPVALAWSAPGTPPTVSATGPAFPAGGAFDTTGRFYLAAATTSVYRWNGSAWTTLATSTGVTLHAVVRAPDGAMIFGSNGAGTIGGATNAVFKYNVAAGTWSAYGGVIGRMIADLAFDNAGLLYAAGGSSLDRSNGVAWVSVAIATGGGGLGIYRVTYNVLSSLIYASGDFTTVNGVAYADSFLAFNGAAPIPPDADLPGTAGTTIVGAVESFVDGSLIVAFNASSNTGVAGTTTVTNIGTAAVYPRLVMYGQATTSTRIYSLINVTTGAAIYFNLTILPGEVVTLTLDPTNITFVSTFQGNVMSAIMPGSNPTAFFLQSGANVISFFSTSGAQAPTMFMDWPVGFNNLSDALYRGRS